MDLSTLLPLIGTSLVVLASLLTNLIPTPAPAAPAWARIGYRVIELIALVGRRTKEAPEAAGVLAATLDAVKAGDADTAVPLVEHALSLIAPRSAS